MPIPSERCPAAALAAAAGKTALKRHRHPSIRLPSIHSTAPAPGSLPPSRPRGIVEIYSLSLSRLQAATPAFGEIIVKAVTISREQAPSQFGKCSPAFSSLLSAALRRARGSLTPPPPPPPPDRRADGAGTAEAATGGRLLSRGCPCALFCEE